MVYWRSSCSGTVICSCFELEKRVHLKASSSRRSGVAVVHGCTGTMSINAALSLYTGPIGCSGACLRVEI